MTDIQLGQKYWTVIQQLPIVGLPNSQLFLYIKYGEVTAIGRKQNDVGEEEDFVRLDHQSIQSDLLFSTVQDAIAYLQPLMQNIQAKP